MATEETLDPDDWHAMRETAFRAVDDAVTHLRDVRDRPIWQDMPQSVRSAYLTPVPEGPQPIAEVYQELKRHLMPYPMGNIHPRFWGWYMGTGSFSGALAEFLAAIDGSNLGGGNNAAALMDGQVVNWLKAMMGFPDSASGTLVSGGTMANIVALTVARNVKSGIDLRAEGVGALRRPLKFYASDQVHSCHQKALELLGLGSKALRRVPTDAGFRIDIEALKAMIAADRAADQQPSCVIATAGTVNTGAIDDLQAIGDLCRSEDLWFHVDGCIGALIAIAPQNRHLVAGLDRADSLALDPHKLLHVPFEAGCALLRDAESHRNSFAIHPEYLEEKPRGVAAAEFLHDYNPQTSRGFRALKIWLTLKEHGVAKFGRLIDQTIALTQHLQQLVENRPELEIVAPAIINILCFRYNPGGRSAAELRQLNTEIMLRLQESGTAVITDTTVSDQHALRIAICNHRTTRADLDPIVDEILRLGAEIDTAA